MFFCSTIVLVFTLAFWRQYFNLYPLIGLLVYFLFGSDISLIYHMIRGQGTIKLYVVYNVLEVISFYKLIINYKLKSLEVVGCVFFLYILKVQLF